MSIRALIFDVDGTLAETEELHRTSFNTAFTQAGLAWNWDRRLYGELLEVTGGKERIARFIEILGAGHAMDQQTIADLHRAKTAIYANAILGGAVDLRPGIRRLLNEARQNGIAVAIATTTSRDSVNALLHASFGPGGVAQFAFIAAGDSVAEKKPAPDIYHLVLKRLGLDGRDAIAIEDTPNGLRAATAAGIDTVITHSAFGGESGFDDAVTVVDHLGDPGNRCRVLQGRGIQDGMVTIAGLMRIRQPPR